MEAEKKIREQIENARIIDQFDYLGNAASTTDCTGLIPGSQNTEEELEDYQEIYRFGALSLDRKAEDKNKSTD